MAAAIGGHTAKSAITNHAMTVVDRGQPNTTSAFDDGHGIPQPPR